MMRSPAFKALSGGALKLLLCVWRRHDGKNNGQISYSVREAVDELGCAPGTAAKWFQELIELGFLAIEKKGAFSVKTKRATEWRITLESSHGGQAPTRDYQRWRPPDENQNTVSKIDVNGVKNCNREHQTEPQIATTVSNTDTVTASDDPSTVSKTDTLIQFSHRLRGQRDAA